MKKIGIITVLFTSILLLVACSKKTGKENQEENYITMTKAIKVKPKMKKYEVKEILGKPSKVIDDQDKIYDSVESDFNNLFEIYNSIGASIPVSDKEKIKSKLADLKYTKFSIDDDVKMQQIQYKTKDKDNGKTKVENVNFYFQDNTLVSSSVKRIE